METTLLTDLSAFWRLNEPSGARYDAHGTNNLTDGSSVPSGAGMFGLGGDFETGSTDYIYVAHNASLSPGGDDFSLGGWIKPENDGATTKTFCIKGKGGVSQKRYIISMGDDAKISFGIDDDGGALKDVVGDTVLVAGTWYHVIGVRDGNNLRVYVDGAEDGAATDITGYGDIDQADNFYLGCSRNVAGLQNYFDGIIDEFGFWKRALSADEVRELYAGGTGVTYPFIFATGDIGEDLISYWELNEESGQRFDRHGSNDLKDNNSVLYGTGKQGNAANFEADNSEYLSHADNADLSFGDEDFTIGTWVKLETVGVDRPIVTKYDTGLNNREYSLLYQHSSTRFGFWISNNGTDWITELADELGAPDAGTWYFIVAWHDSVANTLNIQVNNGTPDSQAYSNGCNDNVTGFKIGGGTYNGSASGYCDGLIDEVGVWNRVLTSDERTALYNGGAGVSYDDLLISDAKAHGGIVTQDGDTIIHTFLEGGVFVAEENFNADTLVVAGGGGGGATGGGGGAGGYRTDSAFGVTAQAYTITVGDGGAGGVDKDTNGINGTDSVLSTITATGGGGGGSNDTDAGKATGEDGGSGGGVGSTGTAGGSGGAAAPPGEGSAGGDGDVNSPYASGGGGGAGAVGGTGSGNVSGGGGAGAANSISGASVTYAGGGSGGWRTTAGGSGTAPGAGGGGTGTGDDTTAAAGAANKGSGGGGGGFEAAAYGVGGAGGSGIVIISYSLLALGRTSTKMAGF
ncbi:MAG: LamG domain-containing protein [Candidatus Peribacteraceae bacterium]|nr:LamG domain-containing protein [Candidatus Peribacteraceae bacterium]